MLTIGSFRRGQWPLIRLSPTDLCLVVCSTVQGTCQARFCSPAHAKVAHITHACPIAEELSELRRGQQAKRRAKAPLLHRQPGGSVPRRRHDSVPVSWPWKVSVACLAALQQLAVCDGIFDLDACLPSSQQQIYKDTQAQLMIGMLLCLGIDEDTALGNGCLKWDYLL